MSVPLQVESRASLYEAGKTVLRYEERLGSGPLAPSSREIIFGPFHSESSQGSEGSQETGDSGHYSTEEMSNPSTSSSSRPESVGPEDAVLKQSLDVEMEQRHCPALGCSSDGS